MLDLDPAAGQLKQVLAAVTDGQLSVPTPCEEYVVADLLDHLVGLTMAFRLTATKSTSGVTGRAPARGRAATLDPDWRHRLPAQLDDLVAAWREPAAWEGMAEAGGVTLPAEVMGSVAVNELVLHGWDLARATGQSYDCDPTSTDVVLGFTTAMSAPGQEAGREGLFGPVVAGQADAPPFDRALRLSGRDPGWTSAWRP